MHRFMAAILAIGFALPAPVQACAPLKIDACPCLDLPGGTVITARGPMDIQGPIEFVAGRVTLNNAKT